MESGSADEAGAEVFDDVAVEVGARGVKKKKFRKKFKKNFSFFLSKKIICFPKNSKILTSQ